jgi:hypothetical protein
MSPQDRLRVGMSIEDACLALPGWRFQQVYAPADPRRYHTWDFTAPGADCVTLRLTFDNRKLLLWGPPADNGHADISTVEGPDASRGLSA